MLTLVLLPLAHAAQDDVIATLCAGRSPCAISETTDAGQDAQGRDLQVVELNLSSVSDPDWAFQVGEECKGRELHLLRRQQGAVVDTRLLLELCNDGYGAHGMGDDNISIADNRLTHGTSGGSTWRWDSTTTWQLSPYAVLETSHGSEWTMGANRSGDSWSWETLSGTGFMTTPSCEDQDQALPETRWMTLPVHPAEGSDGSLGDCTVSVDSANTTGFVVFGEPGEASDGGMRVALSDAGELLVAIHDDVWVDDAASWLLNDHIEVWTAPEASDDMACRFPLEVAQWGIALDGQVHAAYGAATAAPPQVSVSTTDDIRHVRIALGSVPEALTVVFSDTDDGLAQERLIATSTLRFGDAHSLGQTMALEERGGLCSRSAPKN